MHPNAKACEHLVDNLHQLDLVEQRVGADHIGITLVELTVASFLRTVGTPDGLNLIALEGQLQLLTVHHHIAGERHSKVVAQSLLTELSGQMQRIALLKLGISSLCEEVTTVQHFEEQFVTLLAVLAHQRLERLHGWCLNLLEAVEGIHLTNGIEDIIALGHLYRAEVACPFGN